MNCKRLPEGTGDRRSCFVCCFPYPMTDPCMLYMVCHGSHQYTPLMLALIYQHHGSVMGQVKPTRPPWFFRSDQLAVVVPCYPNHNWPTASYSHMFLYKKRPRVAWFVVATPTMYSLYTFFLDQSIDSDFLVRVIPVKHRVIPSFSLFYPLVN